MHTLAASLSFALRVPGRRLARRAVACRRGERGFTGYRFAGYRFTDYRFAGYLGPHDPGGP